MTDPTRLLLSILAIGVSLVAGACPTGRSLDDGGVDCYQMFTKITHADAKAQCAKLGGHLASVHSEAMNKKIQDWGVEVVSTWKDRNASERYTTLLGATSIQTTTYNFRWIDGSPMDYTNWLHEYLDNMNRTEFCLEMYTATHNGSHWAGKWQDLKCKEYAHVVCEKPKPCSEEPGRSWRAGAGTEKCYLAKWPAEAETQYQTDLTYAEADEYCKDANGLVATIHSEAETNAVLASVNKRVEEIWLAATRDKGMETEFTWDDGTPVDYTNWLNLEPNNYDWDNDPKPGQENCIELYLPTPIENTSDPRAGKWEQWGCNIYPAFDLALCKFPVTGPSKGPNDGVTGPTSNPSGPSSDPSGRQTGATSGPVGPSKGTNPGQVTGATVDPLAPSQDPNSGQVSGGTADPNAPSKDPNSGQASGGTPDPNAPSKDPNAGPNGGTTPVNAPSKGGGGGGSAGTTPVPVAPSKDPSK